MVNVGSGVMNQPAQPGYQRKEQVTTPGKRRKMETCGSQNNPAVLPLSDLSPAEECFHVPA